MYVQRLNRHQSFTNNCSIFGSLYEIASKCSKCHCELNSIQHATEKINNKSDQEIHLATNSSSYLISSYCRLKCFNLFGFMLFDESHDLFSYFLQTKILWVDEKNLTACMECGIVGQDLERRVCIKNLSCISVV